MNALIRKQFLVLFVILAVAATESQAQFYSGPASGSVSSGIIISTDNFVPNAPGGPGPLARPSRNKQRVYPLPDNASMPPPTGPEGSNYIPEPGLTESVTSFPPIPIASFQGIGQTNSIPPDPHVAVGPNHIMQVVNTTFRITDKAGTTLKTISADSWYGALVSGVFSFDPKILYDHFANRWIMVWLDQSNAAQRGNYLLSISDDDNPLGVWYNWALDATVNGTTPSGTWADYQGVGFDNEALYFTSNQWTFAGSYQYVKVRIIGKSQLYANTAGAVTWTDYWNVRDSFGNSMIGTRPSIVYGTPGEYYLLANSPFVTSTYMAVYRITNPLTTPTFTVVHVPVVSTSLPPNATQLGSATPIDGGGYNAGLRFEPIYRDGMLWVTHAVRSGSGGQYAGVRYLGISTATNTAAEDVVFGADGYWHIYPALAVDKDNNVAVTFTRTGTNEYASAGFSWRLASDPPGLRTTTIFRSGQGPYVRTDGSRNRWGDYLGIWVDPVDQNNFWMFSEYVPTTNSWGTWVHGIRVVPFPGARLSTSTKNIDFGRVEAGSHSDTATIAVYNFGETALQISSITRSSSAFQLIGLPAFPAQLGTYDSLSFRVVFQPTAHGTVIDSIVFATNDTTSTPKSVAVRGRGVVIGQAQVGVMYAASGAPNGQLYAVNPANASVQVIGELGVAEIQGLAIHPATKELYGVVTDPAVTTLYRVSGPHGDALKTKTIPVGNMRAIAFGPGNTLFGATTTGRLYRFDLATSDTMYIGTSTGITYAGLSFNPVTGELWASVRPAITLRDRIYKVNTTTGTTTLVGATGDNFITPAIAFDATGKLFGLKGSGGQTNTLISIDTVTAVGTLVGSTGISGLQTMTLRSDSISTGVDDSPTQDIPFSFVLGQNYPNPFNPSTQITFGIPVQSRVRVTVTDIVGREVARLVDEVRPAGYHTTTWLAGSALSSGVYFYSLEATGVTDGQRTSLTKKMLLVR